MAQEAIAQQERLHVRTTARDKAQEPRHDNRYALQATQRIS